GQRGGHQQRQDGDEGQAAVVEEQVEHDQGEADGARDQTGLQLLATERGGHGGDAVLTEGQGQGTVGQDVGQVLGLLLLEVPGDLGRAAQGLPDVGVGDDVAVQDD